jgi:hypothetical protein
MYPYAKRRNGLLPTTKQEVFWWVVMAILLAMGVVGWSAFAHWIVG